GDVRQVAGVRQGQVFRTPLDLGFQAADFLPQPPLDLRGGPPALLRVPLDLRPHPGEVVRIQEVLLQPLDDGVEHFGLLDVLAAPVPLPPALVAAADVHPPPVPRLAGEAPADEPCAAVPADEQTVQEIIPAAKQRRLAVAVPLQLGL